MRPIIFVIIIAIAIGAMVLASFLLKEEEKQQLVQQPTVVEKKVPEKLVYVAKVEIPIGAVITQKMLDKQTWPEHLIGKGFVVAGGKAPTVVGMVARAHFQPREVIVRSKLANPEDPSFLAATLPAGQRAVTISVNGVTSVAGFIYPGDRVDVLLTHTLISAKEKEAAELTKDEDDDIEGKYEKRVTEILVPDIRVLAVDQRATASQQQDSKKKRLPSSVTLELSQQDAQRVRLAEREGEISLALRSLKDKGATWVRPTDQYDLTRGLPPGHFPQLYDFDEEFTEEMIQKKKKKEEVSKSIITIVRGSKTQELELEIEDEE